MHLDATSLVEAVKVSSNASATNQMEIVFPVGMELFENCSTTPNGTTVFVGTLGAGEFHFELNTEFNAPGNPLSGMYTWETGLEAAIDGVIHAQLVQIDSGTVRIRWEDLPVGLFPQNPSASYDDCQVDITATRIVDVLVIDEDSIDNGNPPNFFRDHEVNDDEADIGQRDQLRYFANNVGQTITLHTGEVGDEGWFALTTVPDSWANAGPTPDGLRNFVGLPVGPGLGAGNDPEKRLDKIRGVTPLRATGLHGLEGRSVCAVVFDSDISINYDPLDGSLKGDNLGTVAFKVLDVRKLEGFSSSSLPEVDIEIVDADEACEGELRLFTAAPEPDSSSEPFDIEPPPDPGRPPGPRGEPLSSEVSSEGACGGGFQVALLLPAVLLLQGTRRRRTL
jgi:hypothetical protein